MGTSIATAFTDLSAIQLLEWLDEGNPTDREAIAIKRELETRAERRQAIADLLW